jgi:hypothetical protein
VCLGLGQPGDHTAVGRQALKGHLAVAARLHHASDGVVVLVGEGVELVVVAAGAAEGHAQKRLAEGVDPVVHAVGLVLADVDR